MLKEHTSISDEDDDYDSTAPLDIHKARNRLYALDNAREDNRDIISMAPEKKRRKAEKIIMKPILAEAAAIQSRIHDAAVALTNASSSSATVVQQQPKQRAKQNSSKGQQPKHKKQQQQQQLQQQQKPPPPPPPPAQNTLLPPCSVCKADLGGSTKRCSKCNRYVIK